MLKQLLWKDKNLLFALLYQSFIYFTFYSFFDIFAVYCATVIEIDNELILSSIFCIAMLALFLFQMFGLDLDFFESHESIKNLRNSTIPCTIIGSILLVLIYLIRFL